MEQMMTQAFRTALIKCQTTNKYTVSTSFEEFADELTRDVFAILFPRTTESGVPTPVAEVVKLPTVEEDAAKTKKKPGPKPKLDENGNPLPKKPRAKKAAGGGGGGGTDSETESVPAVAPPKEEDVKEVAVPAEKVKKPRAKKVADTPEGPLNFDKFTPTDTKKLKAIATELSVEVDKKALLAYMNALSKEDFNAKTSEAHFRDFLTPKPAAAEPESVAEERECFVIEFKGKTYNVDPESKRVYEERNDANVFVGYVGAGEFVGMKIPDA
jgi:hypothetical protein